MKRLGLKENIDRVWWSVREELGFKMRKSQEKEEEEKEENCLF